MPLVLITGGSGGLGRELVPRFAAGGHTVRILSRRPRPDGLGPSLEWAQGDIETGSGLPDAVAGADLIVHAATGAMARPRVDVAGTESLVKAARDAGTPHLFYISIVGIDRVPLGYYKAKLAAEKLIEEAGVPWSNLRATQFHSLIDMFLHMLYRVPGVLLLPTAYKFQPIDTGEVAQRVVECAARGPCGRLPDLGGPQVLTFGEMARAWLKARRKRAAVLPLPLLGATATGFRRGHNCVPEHAEGKTTWAQWLARKYAAANGP
ncbi:MAG: NAD(P)H-binding protein [Chloroflexi bacterium]|nr:NAD(P)H-binding protein [Chloroflexota bacterium]